MDGVLRFNCTSPEQECILFQLDVGVNDKYEAATPQQAAAREESARPTKNGSSKGRNHGLPIKASNLTPEVNSKTITFLREEYLVAYTVFLFFLCLSAFFCCIVYIMSAFFRSRYERRWKRLRYTRCVNCCTRTGACIVISICVNQGSSLYHFVIVASL